LTGNRPQSATFHTANRWASIAEKTGIIENYIYNEN
jgi:hypothetical protein